MSGQAEQEQYNSIVATVLAGGQFPHDIEDCEAKRRLNAAYSISKCYSAWQDVFRGQARAVAWKMGLDTSCLDDCQHCTLPVAECECHERGRD